MQKNFFFIFILLLTISTFSSAQSGMLMSNPVAEQILLGNYDPGNFAPSVAICNPDSIIQYIVYHASQDTILKKLLKLQTFKNRNSGSDTTTDYNGIGAVRRWLYNEFNAISNANQNRLVLSYLNFNAAICGKTKHKNVLAILPGTDTTDNSFIVIQAHFDTRCEVACDTVSPTPGIDDNGSGTILVLELARIMSRFAFNHTIVFAEVTGEDQGLYGSTALATYFKNKNMKVMACFNNDVVGGITCGHTSSPPGCSPENNIDSTNVRIFSFSTNNDSDKISAHKQLARYVKLHQEERINPLLPVKMNINIQILEDRIGRGGDHIPFRQKGYSSIRFTSHNENGNGQGLPPDHTHTVHDSLGIDITVPPDGIIDSFYIDLNYLKRNIISNGVNAGLLALSPPKPTPVLIPGSNFIRIKMAGNDTIFNHYRIGIRSKGSGSLYFDTVITFYNRIFVLDNLLWNKEYFFSIINVKNNVESIFADEISYTTPVCCIYNQSIENLPERIEEDFMNVSGIELMQNHPNPFSSATTITIKIKNPCDHKNSVIVIKDVFGREVIKQPIDLINESNEIIYKPLKGMQGFYFYSLEIDNKITRTMKMIIF